MSNYIGALALVCLAASADAVRMNDGIPELSGIQDKIDAINNKGKEEIPKRKFDTTTP